MLTEILKLKEANMRLEMQMTQRRGGGSDAVTTGSRVDGAPVSPQGGGTKAAPQAVQIQAMSTEERRATQRLQAEIQSLRKETEQALQTSADLQEQNDELTGRLEELALQRDAEIAQVSGELFDANAQIDALQLEIADLQTQKSPYRASASVLDSPPRNTPDTQVHTQKRPVCRKCEADIEEPLCAECFTSLLPKSSAGEAPASPSAPPGAKPTGASRLAMKARMLSRFALTSPKAVTLQMPLPSEGDALASTPAAAPPAAPQNPAITSPPLDAIPKTPGGIKKKQWSYERDIEQWKEHCDKLIAKEREDCRAKINEKSADIAELFEMSFQGRKDIYAQLVDMER